MADNIINLDDEEAASDFLKKAADASSQIAEKRVIEPLSTEHASREQPKIDGPSWAELMPTVPGTTVNPAADAKQKKADSAEASAIRKPGYDDITQQAAANLPSPPGGAVDGKDQVVGGSVDPGYF